jgi:hypothetical protein
MNEKIIYGKEPPPEFIGKGQVKGFRFKRILSYKNVYLYEVSYYNTTWYEVFIAKYNKRFGCFGYPRPEAFGKYAWCIKSKEEAMQKFNSIVCKFK